MTGKPAPTGPPTARRVPPPDNAAIEKLREELRATEDRLAGAVTRAAKQAAERAKETVDTRLKGDRLLKDLAEKVAAEAQGRIADQLTDRLEAQLLERLPQRVLDKVGPDLERRLEALSTSLPAQALAAVDERLARADLPALAKRLEAEAQRLSESVPAQAKQAADAAVAALDLDGLVARVSEPAGERALEFVQERLKGGLGKQLIGHLSVQVGEEAQAKALAALKDGSPELSAALLPPLTDLVTGWLADNEATLLASLDEKVSSKTAQLVEERLSAFDLEDLPSQTAERVQTAFQQQLEADGLAAFPAFNRELTEALAGLRAELDALQSAETAATADAPAGLDRDAVDALIQERLAAIPAPVADAPAGLDRDAVDALVSERLEERLAALAPAPSEGAELDPIELAAIAERAAQSALQILEDRFETQQERVQEMLDDALAPALSARASQEALKILEGRLYKTEKLLETVEQRLGKASDSARIEDDELARLRDRIAALEQQSRSGEPDPELLSRLERVEHQSSEGVIPPDLEERITNLEASGSDMGPVDLLTDLKYRLAVVEQRVGEVDNPTLRAEVNHTDRKVTLVTDKMADLDRRVENLKENLDLKNLAERVAIHAIGPVMEAIDGRLAEIDIRRLPDKIADMVEEKATIRILRRIRDQLKRGELDQITDGDPEADDAAGPSPEATDDDAEPGEEPVEGYLDDDFAKFRTKRLAGSKEFREALDTEIAADDAAEAADADQDPEQRAASQANRADPKQAPADESGERDLSPAEQEALDAIQALRSIKRRGPLELDP